MQKQKYCYNYPQVPKKLMLSISKEIDQQRKKIKTLRRIILLTSFLLTHLMGNNNLLSTKLTKKRKTIKDVFGTMINKHKVKAKTPLQ